MIPIAKWESWCLIRTIGLGVSTKLFMHVFSNLLLNKIYWLLHNYISVIKHHLFLLISMIFKCLLLLRWLRNLSLVSRITLHSVHCISDRSSTNWKLISSSWSLYLYFSKPFSISKFSKLSLYSFVLEFLFSMVKFTWWCKYWNKAENINTAFYTSFLGFSIIILLLLCIFNIQRQIYYRWQNCEVRTNEKG